MISNLTSVLLCTALLMSCTAVSNSNPTPTPGSSHTSLQPERPDASLPEAIQNQIKAALADDLGITVDQLMIGRYSRETWSDGCLGLGGPAESCLMALTEGWQVEVMDTEAGQNYVYRTDLTGEQIRPSTEWVDQVSETK